MALFRPGARQQYEGSGPASTAQGTYQGTRYPWLQGPPSGTWAAAGVRWERDAGPCAGGGKEGQAHMPAAQGRAG
eukprot:scaffold1018_cov420-Prasinococcus_capsulatus_cf.AAC.15